MLTGHYGPAFIIKAIDKKVALWMLFIAVQVPDIFWGTFILTCIEKARLNTELLSNPLELYYMPYSHGLLSSLIYSLLAVVLLLLFPYFRKNKASAWWIGAAIFSHWVLDFLSHRPDLPVIGNTMKIGLGLWNYPLAAVIVEGGIFLGGAIWYAVKSGGFKRTATWVFWLFISLSLVMSSVRELIMSPVNINSVAVSALCFYVFATLVIYYVEKNEKRP